jgi:hypothetical protein
MNLFKPPKATYELWHRRILSRALPFYYTLKRLTAPVIAAFILVSTAGEASLLIPLHYKSQAICSKSFALKEFYISERKDSDISFLDTYLRYGEKLRYKQKISRFYSIKARVPSRIDWVDPKNEHHRLETESEKINELFFKTMKAWKEQGVSEERIEKIKQSDSLVPTHRKIQYGVSLKNGDFLGGRLIDLNENQKMLDLQNEVREVKSPVVFPLAKTFSELDFTSLGFDTKNLNFQVGLISSNAKLDNLKRIYASLLNYVLVMYGPTHTTKVEYPSAHQIQAEYQRMIRKFGANFGPGFGMPMPAQTRFNLQQTLDKAPRQVTYRYRIEEESLRYFTENKAYIWGYSAPHLAKSLQRLGFKSIAQTSDGFHILRVNVLDLIPRYSFEKYEEQERQRRQKDALNRYQKLGNSRG